MQAVEQGQGGSGLKRSDTYSEYTTIKQNSANDISYKNNDNK